MNSRSLYLVVFALLLLATAYVIVTWGGEFSIWIPISLAVVAMLGLAAAAYFMNDDD